MFYDVSRLLGLLFEGKKLCLIIEEIRYYGRLRLLCMTGLFWERKLNFIVEFAQE